MAAASEWIQHDCTAQSANRGIKVPHEGAKPAALAQYFRTARRERQGLLVFFTRQRKVVGPLLRDKRERQMGLGQSRGERDRPARIGFRFLEALANRSASRHRRRVVRERERSARERERIVRVQPDRLGVRGNGGWNISIFMS